MNARAKLITDLMYEAVAGLGFVQPKNYSEFVAMFDRFEALAVAAAVKAEREECAKLCDFLELVPVPGDPFGKSPARRYANNKDLAAAIRSRR